MSDPVATTPSIAVPVAIPCRCWTNRPDVRECKAHPACMIRFPHDHTTPEEVDRLRPVTTMVGPVFDAAREYERRFRESNPGILQLDPHETNKRRLDEKAQKILDAHRCKECNKPYPGEDRRQKYCSVECARAHRLIHGEERIEKRCPACAGEFTTSDRREKYCSPDCRATRGRPDRMARQVNCPQCSKPFIRSHYAQRYCSIYCRALGSVGASKELAQIT